MSSSPTLVDFAISYGECSGYCTTRLGISGTALELVRISSDSADPDLSYQGKADEDVVSRIERALDGIHPAELDAVYGKPDARDEGAAILRLRSGGGVSEHRYSATDPPAALTDLHAILTGILSAWLGGEARPGVAFYTHPEK